MVLPQVRGTPDQGEISWRLGDDPTLLKPVKAIVALWGASPGSGYPIDDNIKLGLAALNLGLQIGVDRVLLASSAAVYGGALGGNMGETAEGLVPSGAYGQSKLAMEKAAADWAKDHADGPAYCCLRMSNVVGADSLFASLARSSSIVLDQFPSGGGPRRSYVTASDLARVIDGLITLPVSRLPTVLNVAGKRPVSMQAMAQAAGAQVSWRKAPDTALENVAMDTSRLASLLGSLDESANAVSAITAWRKLIGKM